MINRNNNYVSFDKEQLKKIKESRRKRSLVTVGGLLLTITLLSGCGKQEIDYTLPETNDTTIQVLYEDIDSFDLSGFNIDSVEINIVGTNITDVSELINYENVEEICLSDNLITDVSLLSQLPKLKRLDISNNSVSFIDLSSFHNLESIRVEGNYNLYTEDLINYCEQNNISIDITREDVLLVDKLKGILETLNLNGLSDLEKERIIYQYVLDNMEYDHKNVNDTDMVAEYNINALKYAIEGKGVCIGYAVLFDAMCELSGINCYKISGFGNGEAHGWNLVEIDGEYMLCDPTWSDSLPFLGVVYDKTGYNIDSNYNQTGKGADFFMKSHSEGYPGSMKAVAGGYEITELVATNIRSNQAANSNLNVIQDSDTLGEQILGSVDRVLDSIDWSKIDTKKLATLLLQGIALGSVVLLSRKVNKSLKKRIIEFKEKQRENRESLAKEKDKNQENVSFIIDDSITNNETEFYDESMGSNEIDEPVQERELTEQEILDSFQTDEDKIKYLTIKVNEILRKAAEIQIDMEMENKLIDSTFKDDKIQQAMIELVSLLSMTEDEKALSRCQKVGYLMEIESLDNLTIIEKDALNATKRMYKGVDSVMYEYLRLQRLIKDIKNKSMENMTIQEKANHMVQAMVNGEDIFYKNSQTDSFIGGNKKMGFSKIWLLMILTLIISVIMIILGVYFS